MAGTTLPALQALNQELAARLVRLRGAPGRPPAIAFTEFADLRAELLRATELLRNPGSSAADPELTEEVSQYRSHLEQLTKVLPSIAGRLLAEKARLEAARVHVSKASAWAEARAKTL